MNETTDDGPHGPAPSSIWGDETEVVDAVVGWAAHRVVTASDPKSTARPAAELCIACARELERGR